MKFTRRTFLELSAGVAFVTGLDFFGADILHACNCHPPITLEKIFKDFTDVHGDRPAKGMTPDPKAFELQDTALPHSDVKRIFNYYPWWDSVTNPDGRTFGTRHWNDKDGYPYRPLLGEYSSRSPRVIAKHINDMVKVCDGVPFVSWWGSDSWEDQTLRNNFLESPEMKEYDAEWGIFFESDGILGEGDKPFANVCEIDIKAQEKKLSEQFDYLCENYLNLPNYFKMEGIPAVVVYNANAFNPDKAVDVFGNLRKKILHAYGIEVFLFADVNFWLDPNQGRLKLINEFDGITSYSMYRTYDTLFLPPPSNFEELVVGRYKIYSPVAKKLEKKIMFPTSPGFKKPLCRELPRSSQRYARSVGDAATVALNCDGMISAIYNEGHEGASIEGTLEFGNRDLMTFGSA